MTPKVVRLLERVPSLDCTIEVRDLLNRVHGNGRAVPARDGVDGVPELLVRVQPEWVTGVPWVIGDYVRLADLPGFEDAVILDRDGELVETFSGEQFLGQIIGVRPLPEDAHALEYRVQLANYPLGQAIRLRAPSFKIETVVSSTAFVCASLSAFDTATPDSSFLEVGDDVEVWLDDGEPEEHGTREIRTVVDRTITIDAAFTSTPSPGDILRLAEAPNYDNEIWPGVRRAYVYLATTGAIPGYTGRDIYG